MPPHSGILLPHIVRAGREQMELDAALFAWAAGGGDRFAARTYGWSRPTLSLGRAEPFPEGWDARALEADGIDVVRRPTGGDAVLHDEEVTFAVAASIPGPWAERPRAFALRVAEALAAALQGLGLPAMVVPPVAGPVSAPGARPCFARAAAGEVQIDGYKAAGIASRFTRGAALSHASVPLTARHRDVARYRSDAVPAEAELRAHARSIGEARSTPIRASDVRRLLLASLEERFEVRLTERSFDDSVAAPA